MTTTNTSSPTLGEEIANGVSHGVGALTALFFMPVLIASSMRSGSTTLIVSVTIFTIAAFILYLTSTLYHCLPRNRSKTVFRILDHSAIYILIAATYTPFMIGVLGGVWGWTLFGAVWTMAILGVVLKSVCRTTPAWLSTGLYVFMGWIALFVAKPLFTALPYQGAFWLIAGGVAYTFGVIFFVLDEKVRYTHFVWHIFVMLGTACHYVSIVSLLK